MPNISVWAVWKGCFNAGRWVGIVHGLVRIERQYIKNSGVWPEAGDRALACGVGAILAREGIVGQLIGV